MMTKLKQYNQPSNVLSDWSLSAAPLVLILCFPPSILGFSFLFLCLWPVLMLRAYGLVTFFRNNWDVILNTKCR